MELSPKEARAKRRKTGALLLFAVGPLFVATAAALNQFQLLEDVYVRCVLYVGFAFCILGICWTLCGCFRPKDGLAQEYIYRAMIPEELSDLVKFIKTHMGPIGLPTEQEMREIMAANPKIFFAVEEYSPAGQNKMVGFFSILPLKTGAVALLEAGDLSGLGLRQGHIARKPTSVKGIYIGMALGVSLRTKAATLKYLNFEVARICKKQNGPVRVFGRPITDDGLRIAKEHGFVNAIDGSSPMMNLVCVRTGPPLRRGDS